MQTRGEIVTFYSFKGGTGRTMALANLAVLASRLAKKTLVIDWDLEAPGLHRYFANHIPIATDKFDNLPGLLEYFLALKQEIGPNQSKAPDNILKQIFDRVDFNRYVLPTTIDGLFIMKAGRYNEGYAKCINSFDWQYYFNLNSNFFSLFADHLMKLYNYTFIDSRTGVTDTSGICTMLLPEKLCVVFTANRQNLDGATSVAKEALEYRKNSTDFRPLKIYPIPSRVELAEKDLRDLWRKGSEHKKVAGFQPKFEKLFDECYGNMETDLTTYFDAVQIHHEPKYSYGEEIAVLNENYADSLSLTNAYSNIYQKIFVESQIFSSLSGRTNDRQAKQVFISYSVNEKALVNELVARIKKQIPSLYYFDAINTSNTGHSLMDSIDSNIDRSDILIALIRTDDPYGWQQYELNQILRHYSIRGDKLLIPIIIGDQVSRLPSIIAHLDFILFNPEYQKVATLEQQIATRIKHFLKKEIRMEEITERELEILKMLATDLSLNEVAKKINLSRRSLDYYVTNLYRKTQATSRVGLVLYAIKNNIIEIQDGAF